jgi:hypothetical protein
MGWLVAQACCCCRRKRCCCWGGPAPVAQELRRIELGEQEVKATRQIVKTNNNANWIERPV